MRAYYGGIKSFLGITEEVDFANDDGKLTPAHVETFSPGHFDHDSLKVHLASNLGDSQPFPPAQDG